MSLVDQRWILKAGRNGLVEAFEILYSSSSLADSSKPKLADLIGLCNDALNGEPQQVDACFLKALSQQDLDALEVCIELFSAAVASTVDVEEARNLGRIHTSLVILNHELRQLWDARHRR